MGPLTVICLSSCCQLWVLISLNLYVLNSGWHIQGSEAKVLAWGHVSPSPQGREDITERDTVCLSFSLLQLHCCDFLDRAVHIHISQLQRDCCNETRHCSVCAKSSRNHLLPFREEHLQPGCRFPTSPGHPLDYVITEDIRLHSP